MTLEEKVEQEIRDMVVSVPNAYLMTSGESFRQGANFVIKTVIQMLEERKIAFEKKTYKDIELTLHPNKVQELNEIINLLKSEI